MSTTDEVAPPTRWAASAIRVSDVETFSAQGAKGESLVLGEPVGLSLDDPSFLLAFLRFLRDCETYQVRLAWHLAECSREIIDLACHLPAPVDDANPSSTRWPGHPDWRPGLCYWRDGRNFILVRDNRPGRGARGTLDDEESMTLFRSLLAPRAVRTDDRTEPLELMLDEGWVFEIDGHAVALPIRIRSWPIPFAAF